MNNKIGVVLLIITVLLSSCDRTAETRMIYDPENYYTVIDERKNDNIDGNASILLIFLDESDTYVTEVSILNTDTSLLGNNTDELAEEYAFGHVSNCTYFISNEPYFQEQIYIAFYALSDLDAIGSLITYLGLNKELKDGYLSNQELKESLNFRYRELLLNGKYQEN